MPNTLAKPIRVKASRKREPITKVNPIFSLAPEKATSSALESLKPINGLSELVAGLRQLQRERAIVIKSRMMQANRLRAVIAGTLGYSTTMDEKERAAKQKEADKLIKAVMKGTATHPLVNIIRVTMDSIKQWNDLQAGLEKAMVKLAAQLPVAKWVNEPDQHGAISLCGLATIIGEAGDLSNYSGPGKLRKRFGCAPREFNGKNLMGSTWKSGREGKLPASEWESFGYSPRRRSIAYLFGVCIVKGNRIEGDSRNETEIGVADDLDSCGDIECDTDQSTAASEGVGAGEKKGGTDAAVAGPYRIRYDSAKRSAAERHPEWSKQHCHNHGMLLATKLLLKNLWIEWRRSTYLL